MSHALMLAAVGLEGPGWDSEYYPDDLPEDWRLGYYANEYPGVLIPAAVWAEDPDVAQWLEDVSEGFVFYLQFNDRMPGADLNRALMAAEQMEGCLQGLILEAEGNEAYENLLEHLSSILPGHMLAVMTPFRDMPLCWQGNSGDCGPYGPGLLRLEQDMPPRQLRALLEQFCAATDSETPVLFVEAPVPVFETLRTLIDLMGL
jgi:hypothetical protein